MKPNQKGFAMLVGVLIALCLAAVIFGAFLYATQTAKPKPAPAAQKAGEKPVEVAQPIQNATGTAENQQIKNPAESEAVDTADWQTYRNEEWGFEIGLPIEWVHNYNESSNTSVVYSGKAVAGNSISRGVVFTLMSAQNLELLVEKLKNDIIGFGNAIDKIENIAIGGQSATRMESHYAGPSATKRLDYAAGYYISLPNAVEVKSKKYNFIYVGLVKEDENLISSFKFVDKRLDVVWLNGTTTYSMVKTEKGFLFPQITAFEDEKIKEKVNTKLKEEADSFCQCDAPSDLTGCQVDAKVTYSLNYIFSVAIFSNWSCEKQLHDARGWNSYVFDMKTGQIAGFEDVFGLPANRLGQQISDGLANVIYKNVKNINQCPEVYELEDIKNYSYSYFIADKGIAFTPSISYAGLACTEDIVVPVAEVMKFAKSGSILQRMVR